MPRRSGQILPLLLGASLLLTACTQPSGLPAASPQVSDSPAPVIAVDLAAGEDEDRVHVAVDGSSQVVFRQITLQPGAGTGEHCHAGQLIAVVEQGTFTHYAPSYPDGVHVYHSGEAIVEGAGYVHHGLNEGTEDVVLLVTYIISDGEPLAQTDLTKCDGVAP
jgi:quercetin dioxygenase-like cupin family protein